MRIGRETGKNRLATAAIAAVVFAAALGVALGVAQATDRPAFCGSTCHEMAPFHDAWRNGPHPSVSCIDCHVDAGIPARLSHKVVAVKEVWSHVAGEPRFPLQAPAAVPDERCVRCHDRIAPKIAGFDHARHARDRTCASCHPNAGHTVTEQTLAAAGVLNTAYSKQSSEPTSFASIDGGSDNLPGHATVPCSRCHDMAATGCVRCHEPRHEEGGAAKSGPCHDCHTADGNFAFAHPSGPALDCEACHTRPSGHRTGNCSTCHQGTGESWAFTHPDETACTDCHDRPAKHARGTCTTCHKAGANWAFKHPRRGADCASCHEAPAEHRSGACVTCHHKAGVSWAFTHPASDSCTSCHTRPANHRAGACTSCHRAGRSWAYRHTGSSACSSCHSAPARHYGSSCASCHAPGRPWSSATFSHPRIPGGEHTYRSFSCASCHPSGYSSASCTRCHDGSGEDEDDD